MRRHLLHITVWIPLLAVFRLILEPPGGFLGCVPEFTAEDTDTIRVARGEAQGLPPSQPDNVSLTGITAYSCGGGPAYDDDAAKSAIWAGVVDRKALGKPAPLSPPLAGAARVVGTVAVSVFIDGSGKVVRAQVLSGHPLLRQSALEAACRARFSPTLVNGPPVWASGVLTYGFGL